MELLLRPTPSDFSLRDFWYLYVDGDSIAVWHPFPFGVPDQGSDAFDDTLSHWQFRDKSSLEIFVPIAFDDLIPAVAKHLEVLVKSGISFQWKWTISRSGRDQTGEYEVREPVQLVRECSGTFRLTTCPPSVKGILHDVSHSLRFDGLEYSTIIFLHREDDGTRMFLNTAPLPPHIPNAFDVVAGARAISPAEQRAAHERYLTIHALRLAVLRELIYRLLDEQAESLGRENEEAKFEQLEHSTQTIPIKRVVLDEALEAFCARDLRGRDISFRRDTSSAGRVIYHLHHPDLGNIGTIALQKITEQLTQVTAVWNLTTKEETLHYLERAHLYMTDELDYWWSRHQKQVQQGIDQWESIMHIMPLRRCSLTLQQQNEVERQLHQRSRGPILARAVHFFEGIEAGDLTSPEAQDYIQHDGIAMADMDDPHVQIVITAQRKLSDADTLLREQRVQQIDKVVQAYLDYLQHSGIWGGAEQILQGAAVLADKPPSTPMNYVQLLGGGFESSVVFNGTVAQFGSAVNAWKWRMKNMRPNWVMTVHPLPPLDPTATEMDVYISANRSNASTAAASIVAQSLPNNQTQVWIRAQQEYRSAIVPIWEALIKELEQQGWIATTAKRQVAQPDLVNPSKRKKGAHADTREKVLRLAEHRESKKNALGGLPTRTGKHGACEYVGIEPDTVKKHAPKLYNRWYDKEYVFNDADYIE